VDNSTNESQQSSALIHRKNQKNTKTIIFYTTTWDNLSLLLPAFTGHQCHDTYCCKLSSPGCCFCWFSNWCKSCQNNLTAIQKIKL